MRVWDNSICTTNYAKLGLQVRDTMLCAAERSRDVCKVSLAPEPQTTCLATDQITDGRNAGRLRRAAQLHEPEHAAVGALRGGQLGRTLCRARYAALCCSTVQSLTGYCRLSGRVHQGHRVSRLDRKQHFLNLSLASFKRLLL